MTRNIKNVLIDIEHKVEIISFSKNPKNANKRDIFAIESNIDKIDADFLFLTEFKIFI